MIRNKNSKIQNKRINSSDADSSDCDDILPGPGTNYGVNKLFNTMLFIAPIFIYFEGEIASKHHRLIGLDASELLSLNGFRFVIINSTVIFFFQEICEFRKLLSFLNKKMALPVCFFTVLNLSYTFSAIIYFIRIYNQFTSHKIVLMALVNILFWLVLGLYPFFQVILKLRTPSNQKC